MRGATVVLLTVLATGCAGRSQEGVKNQAPRVAASKKAAPKGPSAGYAAASDTPASGGMRHYLDKPSVRVPRIGAPWSVRLDVIAVKADRARVEADLQRLAARWRGRRQTPPGQARLSVVAPGQYALVTLPAALVAGVPATVHLFVWSLSSGAAPPLRLSVRPAGRLSVQPQIVHQGHRRERRFTLTVPRAGPIVVDLHAPGAPRATPPGRPAPRLLTSIAARATARSDRP